MLLATFGQFERRLIAQRTREALAVKKSQGIRLGRPSTTPKKIVNRIKRGRAAGRSYAAIAERLNHDGVTTAQGGRRWYPYAVRHVFRRHGQR